MIHPRVHRKRKIVCLYSPNLNMFEILHITDKGLVSRKIATQSCFTDDIKHAFRQFNGIPLTGFRIVTGIDIRSYNTWNEYAEAVWQKTNKKLLK